MKIFLSIIVLFFITNLSANSTFGDIYPNFEENMREKELKRLKDFFGKGIVKTNLSSKCGVANNRYFTDSLFEPYVFDDYSLELDPTEIIYPNKIKYIDFEPIAVRYNNPKELDKENFFYIDENIKIRINMKLSDLKQLYTLKDIDLGINGDFKPKNGIKSELIEFKKEYLENTINQCESKINLELKEKFTKDLISLFVYILCIILCILFLIILIKKKYFRKNDIEIKTNQIEQDTKSVKIDENISNNETKILKKENSSTFKEFYYSHHGSIGRKEFFARGFLPLTALSFFVVTIFQITNIMVETNLFFKFLNYGIIAFLFFTFVLILNVSVKRLHDTNNNGWWAMLNFIPIMNFLLLAFLFFAPSKKDNIYGIKSEYPLNSKKFIALIFYILMLFILPVVYGFTKEIIKQNQNEKVQNNSYYQEKKDTQDNIKIVENENIKQFNDILVLAEQGDANAQLKIGNMYRLGKGINQDSKEAVKWLEKAANHGNSDIQFFLGGIYSFGKGISQDYKEAFRWLKESANQGNANAQYALGDMYHLGRGINQDYKIAIEWFEKSANQGNSNAQYALGHMYMTGKGVKKDYKKAFKFYEKSANQGDANAQFLLGNFYSLGEGVKQNYNIAKHWYGKACDNGIKDACDLYKVLNQ